MSAAPLYAESDPISAIMGRVNEIAVLPHVVYKVLELSGSAESTATEMERAIVVDPGFSSRVLALANSAYLGLPKKVSSIKEAIMYCGFKNVRELAMTVGVYDMFVGKSDKESLRRRGWWRHSVDTAVCAKYVAAKVKTLPADEAYTCGLLHLIGKTLLDRFGGEDYVQVENLIAAGFDDVAAEREVYGCDHVAMVLAASRKWGFPEPLSEGLNYVDAPAPNDEYHLHRACVAVATEVAKHVIEGPAHPLTVPTWALHVLNVDESNQQEILDGAVTAIGQAASIH